MAALTIRALNGKIEALSKQMQERDERILKLLHHIDERLHGMHKDFIDLAKKIDAATSAVAGRIDRLSNSIKNSMTDEEVAEVKTALQAEVDRLTVLGQDPANPIPPE